MVPVLACTLFFIMGAVTLRRQARVPSTWELGSNLMKSSSASFVWMKWSTDSIWRALMRLWAERPEPSARVALPRSMPCLVRMARTAMVPLR
ncbi:hypothetical protein D3C71_528730 [compost metagenome]